MRTIETTVYQFSELSNEAKQNAVNELSDINVHFEWWEPIYEDAQNIGLKITSFDLDRYRSATGEFILSACEVAQNILNEHGEMCETYKTAESFLNAWNPVFSNYLDETHKNYESSESEYELLELEHEFLSSILEDYSIMLQKESEYRMTDEAIIETIEANEYEFTENGKMI